MNKGDGSVVIYVDLDSKGAINGLKNVQGHVEKMAGSLKRIGLMVGAAFGVASIARFGKEAIQLGSDLEEVQNVVDVTFGNLNKEINAFSKNAITKFGLSEISAKRFSSTMGAMLKSMGFTERQAADMGMALTGLAGDMASFYNLDAEDAFYKIRAGISGETEPLKQLGVNLSVANLEQYALTRGITKSYKAMTQQEQALLRYNYLLSVTSDAQGDFSRTSESWANQTRILSEQFNSIKATIGQGLINVFTPVIGVINTLLSKIATVANAFKALTELLTGKKSSTYSVPKISGDEYQDAASGAQRLADATNNIAGATKRAGEEQGKLLAGFDEINKLGEPNITDGSGGGEPPVDGGVPSGSPIDYGELQQGNTVIDDMTDSLQNLLNYIEPLRNIDFSPLKESLQGLKQSFKDLGGNIKESLDWVYFNILVPLATWAIEDLAPASVNLFSAAIDLLNETIDVLQPLGEWLWDKFLQPIAKWSADALVDGLNGLTDALRKLSDWISENETGIQNFITILGSITGTFGLFVGASKILEWVAAVAEMAPQVGLLAAMFPKLSGSIAAIGTKIGGVLSGLLGGIASFLGISTGWVVAIIAAIGAVIGLIIAYWDEIKLFFTETIPQAWNDFVTWLSGKWEEFVAWFSGIWEKVKLFFTEKIPALWDSFLEFLGGIWDKIVDWFKNFINGIKEKFLEIANAVRNGWEQIKQKFELFISYLNAAFYAKFTEAFGKFCGIFDGFLLSVRDLWESVKKIFNGVIDFIGGVFSGDWSRAWEGIKSIFSGIWDGLVAVIKAPINGIIGLLNGLINGVVNGVNLISEALNSIQVTIPDWVPVIGGYSLGFNLPIISAPQIPYLAKGAVIPPNAPFMAMLGDQKHGTNIEAPLETIKQALAEVLAEYGGGDIEIRFTGDLAQLARLLAPEITRKQRQSYRALGV